MAIKFTERAVREVRKIITGQPGERETYLRIGIKPGGCSGFIYVVDLCAKPGPQDIIYDAAGVQIVCDRVSDLYLDGTTIDFGESSIQQGFIFNNPIAKTTCPCGESFTV